jgi:F-type H+-transporting ATPase subunit b
MHRRSGMKWKAAGIALAAFFCVLMLGAVPAATRAYAQEAHPTAQSATSEPSTAQETTKEAAAKEANEAVDSSEALKHSSAVRWISKQTGLSMDQAYWACVILNFAIVFFAIWIPMRKRLPGLFKSRTDAIHQRIQEAQKASEEARSRLTEVEGRLARLDTEIAAMRRDADENARAEEKRIMAEAEEERKRIVTAAEQEIATAANAARRDLKAYAGELAVDLAAKRIRVGEDADQALVREFTSQLGKDGNY